jgi:hypothetical protein
MVDLIRESYPNGDVSRSHVAIEEVAPGTGWGAGSRWADVLVLSVWPSKGLTLHGYEVKASRADLKRELADPSKHQALARFCDEWWLVVWDESVLVDGIPEDWGIMLTVEDEHGGRYLTPHRKAAKRAPEQWSRPFVCSLVRNAFEQSPGIAYAERLARQARQRGLDDGRQIAETAQRRLLDRLAEVLYGRDRYRWPLEARDEEKLVEATVQRLNQGVLKLEHAAGGAG